MKVELYNTVGYADDISALCNEGLAREIIDRRNLTGQQALAKTGTLVSWPEMTAERTFIARTVCPATTDVEAYAHGPIPAEVLEEYDRACETGFFDKGFKVWHPTHRDPDPFLVGYHKRGQYDFEQAMHLIARWGPELLPWEVLKADAITAWVHKQHVKLAEAKEKLNAFSSHLAAVEKHGFVDFPDAANQVYASTPIH